MPLTFSFYKENACLYDTEIRQKNRLPKQHSVLGSDFGYPSQDILIQKWQVYAVSRFTIDELTSFLTIITDLYPSFGHGAYVIWKFANYETGNLQTMKNYVFCKFRILVFKANDVYFLAA